MSLAGEVRFPLVAPTAAFRGNSTYTPLQLEEDWMDQSVEVLAHDNMATSGDRTGRRTAAGVLAFVVLLAVSALANKFVGGRIVYGSPHGLVGASLDGKAHKKGCSKSRRLSIAAECRTPQSGDECHDMVMFLKSKGIELRSMFYKGLSSESSFEEIQSHVHQTLPKVCAPPCSAKKSGKSSEDDDGSDSLLAELGLGDDSDCDEDTYDDDEDKPKKKKGHCHTAKPGDACYAKVIYVATDGVTKRPLAFTGLNMATSLHHIQAFLNENPDIIPDANCPYPCEEQCHDAIEGEPCYTNIEWAMTDGINSKDAPVWFPGLSNQSSFVEFQWSIANDMDARVHCPYPCEKFCRTAHKGEKCFEAVDWVMRVGVRDTPEKYKDLSVYSSFEKVQMYLFNNKSEASAMCPEPCQPGLPV